MLKLVTISFVEEIGDDAIDESPSFQMYATTLADVAVIGDYVQMKTWDHKKNRASQQLVQVVARQIGFQPDPPEGRYSELDEMTYFVTLRVRKVAMGSVPEAAI